MNADARDNPSVSVRPPRRCRLRVLGLLIIFASGAAVGWAVSKLLPKPPEQGWTMERARDRTTERIADRVGLSDEQTEQVRKIVEQRLLAVREVRKQIDPEMKVQTERMAQQIAAILTDQQKAKWDEYYAELCQRWFARPETQPATGPTQPGN